MRVGATHRPGCVQVLLEVVGRCQGASPLTTSSRTQYGHRRRLQAKQWRISCRVVGRRGRYVVHCVHRILGPGRRQKQGVLHLQRRPPRRLQQVRRICSRQVPELDAQAAKQDPGRRGGLPGCLRHRRIQTWPPRCAIHSPARTIQQPRVRVSVQRKPRRHGGTARRVVTSRKRVVKVQSCTSHAPASAPGQRSRSHCHAVSHTRRRRVVGRSGGVRSSRVVTTSSISGAPAPGASHVCALALRVWKEREREAHTAGSNSTGGGRRSGLR